jgi:hypothetical protein
MSCGSRPTSSKPNTTVYTKNIVKEKNIPLDKTFVMLYVFALLDDYDKSIDKGDQPLVNIYKDDILIKTENGKYAIVPDEIKQYAITQWTNRKSSLNMSNDDYDDYETDDTLVDTLFQLIYYLLIIFLVLYTLNLFKKYICQY